MVTTMMPVLAVNTIHYCIDWHHNDHDHIENKRKTKYNCFYNLLSRIFSPLMELMMENGS